MAIGRLNDEKLIGMSVIGERSAEMALADRHPDAERLGEYAEGALTEVERTEVERHLVDCEECRAVLSDTIVLGDEEGAAATAADVRPFPRRRWVTGVAVALAAAAALVLAVRIVRPEWVNGIFGPRADRPELQELIVAMAKEPTRLVAGRLSGGFKYAPSPPVTRGIAANDVSAEVRIAAARIDEFGGDGGGDGADAQGLASLVLGDEAQAIDRLTKAERQHPRNAAIASDLASAHLQACLKTQAACAEAVAAADRALAVDDHFLPALFNRAVGFELMSRPEAADAWREYLKADSHSEWSEEARRRLSRLTNPR